MNKLHYVNPTYRHKIFDDVKYILKQIPESRDSDPYLVYQFYKNTISNFRPEGEAPMTVDKFFNLLHKKAIPSFSSITRAKRMVMEVYPEYRGVSYAKRKKKAEEMMKYTMNKKNNEIQVRSARRTLSGHN